MRGYRINKSSDWWGAFILFAIILQPDIFTQIRFTFLIFSVFDVLIFGWFFSKSVKRGTVSKMLLWWLIIRFYLLLIMVLQKHTEDVDNWGRLTILVSDSFMVVDWYCKQNKTRDLLSATSSLGVFYLMIQTAGLILFPDGLLSAQGGSYHFLGTRNTFLPVFFVFFLISGINYIYYKEKHKLIISTILILINILVCKVSTAILCAALIVLLILFRKPIEKFIRLKNLVPIAILMSILFISFGAASWFKWIIVDLLGKDILMNSRGIIWNQALNEIFQSSWSFIFGHGIVNNGNFVSIYNSDWPAHNQLLQWVYEYGLIGTVSVCAYLAKLDSVHSVLRKDMFFIRIVCFSVLIGCISSGLFRYPSSYMCFVFLFFSDQMSLQCASSTDFVERQRRSSDARVRLWQ